MTADGPPGTRNRPDLARVAGGFSLRETGEHDRVTVTPTELTRLAARADSLAPKDAQQLLWALGQEADARCATDGKFWLRFVRTRDEADPAEPVKPFPIQLAYTRALWDILEAQQEIVIAKSRQMIVSWEIVCFCVWWARYRGNQAVFWQTKNWPDAVAMTCMPEGGFEGRCQFIETHLPEWMRLPAKFSEGRVQYPNGSIIQALSGGAGNIRSKTPSLIIEDEFAHQEDQAGVYTAVAPLIQKGAKAIFVSSPNGSGNYFATLYHGYPVGQETPA
jgi:hypothetical protein